MTPYFAYSVLGCFQGETLSNESLDENAREGLTGVVERHYIPPLFLEIEWLSFVTEAKLHMLFLSAIYVNS